MTRPFSFVVSLHADLRPLVVGLNRQLEMRGAPPVRKEELPEIDEMLHAVLGSRTSEATRCSRCRGYASVDGDGELICLNCGRPVAPRRELNDVIEEIAENLIRYRQEQVKSA